jgi:Rad3-related DNA helicase
MRTAADPIFRRFAQPLFPAQANIAAALAHALTQHPSAVLSAEMGTGKSRVSIATAILARSRRTLILSPPAPRSEMGR